MKKVFMTLILAFAASMLAAGAAFAGGRITKTTGGYEVSYFITDHLGSTRAVVSSSGTVLGTNDYYPFGKLWESSDIQAPTTRYLFSGKEQQTTGGINYMDFGARMYDDFLGRWFVHDPMSEDYYPLSPYAYCGNNPVIYSDYNGEWFGIDDLIAGVIGGVVNLVSNAIQGNIHSIGDGFAAFGAGVVAGDLALYGPAGWAAGGAVLGVTNSYLSGNTGLDLVRDGALGAITSVAGGYAGQWASQYIGNVAVNGLNISSQSIIGGTVSGVISGSVSGFTTGALYGLVFDPEHMWKHGLQGAYNGGLTGGITGGFGGYLSAKQSGRNIWTGKQQIEYQITAEDLGLQPTLDRIERGESFPHKNDGTEFKNIEKRLPQLDAGEQYIEYVHPTPKVSGPGMQRIIYTPDRQIIYYTPNHYKAFIKIRITK
jgi:RHS repeat-associated protein